MPTRVIEHLRKVVLSDGAGIGDGELLGRFIERHDGAALAALVKRDGPMVWGVCRRLLGHHDAEDAFQATFIVLVRKAASVMPRGMVGNWLYGVCPPDGVTGPEVRGQAEGEGSTGDGDARHRGRAARPM